MKHDRFMTREERKARDADFKKREAPRMLWPLQNGTAARVRDRDGRKTLPVRYKRAFKAEKVKHKPTEAEDNAIGRKLRRRTNKALRGWLPHAQR